MLTVILFPESERDYVLKYQFVFVNFQMDKRIVLCEWKKGMTHQDILGELDSLTAECREWKLMIFGGALPEYIAPNTYFCGPFEDLLSVYTSTCGGGVRHTVSGFLPSTVWYLGYREKRLRRRDGSTFFEQVDVDRRFGGNFRVIWFEVDTSSNMQHCFDQFRIACGLLVLAINDIPTYFLECGYSYQLDIGIARKDFAEYIACLRAQMEQIKKLTLEAYKDLENDYRNQSKYPYVTLKKSSFKDKRTLMDGDIKLKKLKWSNLLKALELESVLDANRKWIRSRRYFPKGILKLELAKVQYNIDATERVKCCLNDAAKDQLEQELLFALDKLQRQQKKRIAQRQIMSELKVAEKRLMQARARWQWGNEKKLLWLVLAIVEMLLFSPFSIRLLFFVELPLLVTVPLAVVGSTALCYGCCALLFGLAARFEFFVTKQNYEKILREGIEQTQEERLQYMEETVDLVAQYQYAIHLKKGDQDQLERLEQRKKTLARHTHIRGNGESICRQMEILLGEDERVLLPGNSHLSVDFTKDPNEVEYYWIPYRYSKSMAELNKSGHLVNVFFRFISEISLKKTPGEFQGQ